MQATNLTAELWGTFKPFLDQTPDFIYAFDLDGRFTYINRSLLNLWQKPLEEVIGKNFFELDYPAELAERLHRQIQEVIETKAIVRDETHYTGADGTIGYYQYIFVPAFDDTGKLIAVAGSTRDMSDHKRVEGELARKALLGSFGTEVGAALTQAGSQREALQRCTEAAVNHLNTALAQIWTLSADGNFLDLQASTGLRSHLDGEHARVPVEDNQIGRVARSRQPHLNNGLANDPEVSDPNWVGQHRLISFAGYPLLVENRLVGVIAMFARQELTEEALAALKSVSATIAISIERARSEEALASYAETLKRSNEDLEEFALVASHDLRSPLNTVLSFTELMARQEGSLSPDMQAHLNRVRSSAERMTGLISALLTYARLNDTDSVPSKPMSPTAALDAAIQDLDAVICETATLVDQGELPGIVSGPDQLSQVFQNLIANAIHYRSDAPPIITVRAEKAGNFWQFSIADNGVGIAAEYHDRIFQPFKRLYGSDRPGSGIGLAFCRKVVERAGGRIWVESEEGKGSIFRFTLPTE